ncbi:MAG: chloride channel protein [Acidobacteria bacterium]|nr:chloride channel protein [Acidobacteriota bacterium]
MKDGLPIAPSLSPTLQRARITEAPPPVDRRVLFTSLLAMGLGALAALVAEVLTRLIALITNLSFYGRWSLEPASPAGHHLGPWVIVPPVVGGLVVGLMARYGSAAIRGHGIPEAMEQVLVNRSRIPPRLTILKPVSAAIAIGTGGPFGAEGPIIATGGALGSLVGQAVKVTSIERKILLSAGAAAGMAATFGTPVAGVLLAIELLLFEFRARSIIPVALATAVATAVRISFRGADPVFTFPVVAQPGGLAVAVYIALGAAMGLVGVAVTRAVFAVEDMFERLPLNWMWWPAIGGMAVGLIGLVEPATMGVGYDNIDRLLQGVLSWQGLLLLGLLKFLSWSIALGSGTSGGTLAPLFTIGGALGAALGGGVAVLLPYAGVDPRLAALVGMAALFTGASHSMLTWVVFAFETTRQPVGLLPLLGGCATAYLISMLNMRYSIMSEKIARRGIPVARGYEVDHLRQQSVRDWASSPVVSLRMAEKVADARARLRNDPALTHQGFPVVTDDGHLVGVVTRRDLQAERSSDCTVGELVRRPPVVAYRHWPLREAADEMLRQHVGRLPVVDRANPDVAVGILTRSDILRAHGDRLDELHHRDEPSVGSRLRSPRPSSTTIPGGPDVR